MLARRGFSVTCVLSTPLDVIWLIGPLALNSFVFNASSKDAHFPCPLRGVTTVLRITRESRKSGSEKPRICELLPARSASIRLEEVPSL
jgi:hypothetical protein